MPDSHGCQISTARRRLGCVRGRGSRATRRASAAAPRRNAPGPLAVRRRCGRPADRRGVHRRLDDAGRPRVLRGMRRELRLPELRARGSSAARRRRRCAGAGRCATGPRTANAQLLLGALLVQVRVADRDARRVPAPLVRIEGGDGTVEAPRQFASSTSSARCARPSRSTLPSAVSGFWSIGSSPPSFCHAYVTNRGDAVKRAARAPRRRWRG